MKSTKDRGDTLADEDSTIDDAIDTTPFANNDKDEFRTGIHWARSEGIGRSAGWAMYIPKRLIVTVLLGMGMLLVHATRTNVGTLAVMMLDERSIETEDVKLNSSRTRWDSRQVGWLHSLFYVGIVVNRIPAAFGTMKWPSHRLFGGCILVSALFNLFLPVCIENNQYTFTCIIRTCQGVAEGFLLPALYGVLRHWTVPSERSRQVTAVLSCRDAGALIGFLIAGVIVHYLRWQYMFYFFGGLCILWWLIWACLAYEKPSHHASISDAEFEFMTHAQGDDVKDYVNVKIPWKSILTSLPVAAMCLCHFVSLWVRNLFLTNGLLYLSTVGFNIAEVGALASLPYASNIGMSVVSGILADFCLNKKYLTTTVVRKIFIGVGFGLVCVGFLVLATLSGRLAVIIVLIMSFGAFGLAVSGWSVNHYDLSTRYASVLVAVTATSGSIGSVLVPIATGHLTVKQDLAGWAHVFYLTAGIILLATIVYLIFGSGETQMWSNPTSNFRLVEEIQPLAKKPYNDIQVQNCPPCTYVDKPVGKHNAIMAIQSYTMLPSVANGDGVSCRKTDRGEND